MLMKRLIFGILSCLVMLACAAKPIRISFRTPEETFHTWEQAAARLNLPLLISCYARDSRDEMRRDISGTSPQELRAMQKETRETQFKVEKVVYENNQAYVRVLRRRDKQEEIEILTMIRENNGWKIVP